MNDKEREAHEKALHERVAELKIEGENVWIQTCHPHSSLYETLYSAIRNAFLASTPDYSPAPTTFEGLRAWRDGFVRIFRDYRDQMASEVARVSTAQEERGNHHIAGAMLAADKGKINVVGVIYPVPQNRVERFIRAESYVRDAEHKSRELNFFKKMGLTEKMEFIETLENSQKERHSEWQRPNLFSFNYKTHEEGLQHTVEDELGAAAMLIIPDIHEQLVDFIQNFPKDNTDVNEPIAT